ncbi:MAG: hypothetical protein ACRD68_10635 [Pyrinomonadaceae bacterium]
MSAVAARIVDAKIFGVCPGCLSHDGYLNVSGHHHFVCHRHRVYWRAGPRLFSGWRLESPETWGQNTALLSGYKEIRPFVMRPAA